VPCGIVNTIADYVVHPQALARDSVIEAPTDGGTVIHVPGVVPRLVDTPGSVERLGASPGELGIDAAIAGWPERPSPESEMDRARTSEPEPVNPNQ
jgi:crotonobetainyl-CoA:carnitine CoA-transferase CaiB-like acyl-CoA transferase